MKCLEKDPGRRYDTTNALAMDLRRHLNNEAVLASPPSNVYKVRKFIRRNRVATVAGTGVFAILVLATIVSFDFYRTAEKRADELEQVADFQGSQLKDIDAELMGTRLRQDLLDRARAGTLAAGRDEAAATERVATLEQALAGVNFTDAALNTLDENIFERALAAVEEQFASQPMVKARLLQTIADTLVDLGLLDRATKPQEEAVRIRRERLGNDHPSTLTSINNLGTLLQDQGKLSEAESFLNQALQGFRHVLGDSHPDTLAAINNFGTVRLAQGRFAEAEAYYREALHGRRRVLGEDHPRTMTSLNNLGHLLYRQDKFADAERCFREALEVKRRVLGIDHANTLTALGSLGLVLESEGKLPEAEQYCREALDGLRRVLGNDHPSTLTAINNMGKLLFAQGKLTEAEEYLRETLDASRRILGIDHPDTLISLNNVAEVLRKQGEPSRAEPFYREALDVRRRSLGDDHPETITSINNMGKVLRDLGRFVEAEALGAEAVRRSRNTAHSSGSMILLQHARTLAAMGRFSEAEVEMIEVYESFPTLGRDSEQSVESITQLAALYDGRNVAEPGRGFDATAAEWRSKLSTSSDETEAARPARFAPK